MAEELSQSYQRYQLADCTLDAPSRQLLRAGAPVHLAHRPFEVLLYLIEHRERMVSRAELLERFWEGREVYDVALSKCVGVIRKALGDQTGEPRFIETRWAEGYRYIGPLEELLPEAPVMTERVRAVRVVVEEEVPDPAPVVAAAPSLPAAQPQRRRWLAGGGLALIVLVGLGGLAWRRSHPPAPAPTLETIAVLPLQNLSGDAAQEYLSDGVTDSLISELAQVRGLRVIIARGAAFKGRAVDPREAGRRLGVGAVLEGSVLRQGETVRLKVRLVSTADGRVLWTDDSYERPLADIFKLQDEISCNVAAQLRLQLCASDLPPRRYTDNLAAYQLYLRGRYLWGKRTVEAINQGIGFYEQAIALDPRYGLAYAGIATACAVQVANGVEQAAQVAARGKAAAQKAIELDDKLAEAHAALGLMQAAYEWNGAAAEQSYRRALDLNPANATAQQWYGILLMQRGRLGEARAAFERALTFDPLALMINTNLGDAYLNARQYDRAIAQYRKTLDLEPAFLAAHIQLGHAYALAGRTEEALAECRRCLELNEMKSLGQVCRGFALARAGRRAEAQQQLDTVSADLNTGRGFVSLWGLARGYAALGDKERAFELLSRASEDRSGVADLKVEPALDSLRADPRYTVLLRRVGLPE